MVRNLQDLPWSTTGSVRIVPFCRRFLHIIDSIPRSLSLLIPAMLAFAWNGSCRNVSWYELDGFGDVRCFRWVICSIQRVHFLSDALKLTPPRTEHLQEFAVKFPWSKICQFQGMNQDVIFFIFHSQISQLFAGALDSKFSLVVSGNPRAPKKASTVMFDGPFGAWKTRNPASEVATVVVFYVAGCFMWWFGDSFGMFWMSCCYWMLWLKDGRCESELLFILVQLKKQ